MSDEAQKTKPKKKSKKPKKKFTPEQIALIEQCAGIRLPMEHIATLVGCSKDAIESRMKEAKDTIKTAIEKGRAAAMHKAHGWAYSRAFIDKETPDSLAGNTTMAIFWLKTQARWKEPDVMVDPNAAPKVVLNIDGAENVTAAMEKYFDKPRKVDDGTSRTDSVGEN